MKKIILMILCSLLVGCQKSMDPEVEKMLSSVSIDQVEFYHEDHRALENPQYYKDLLENKQYNKLMKVMYQDQVKFVEVKQDGREYTFHTYKTAYDANTLFANEIWVDLTNLEDLRYTGGFLSASNTSLGIIGVNGLHCQKTQSGYEIKFSYKMNDQEKDWQEDCFDRYIIKNEDIS